MSKLKTKKQVKEIERFNRNEEIIKKTPHYAAFFIKGYGSKKIF